MPIVLTTGLAESSIHYEIIGEGLFDFEGSLEATFNGVTTTVAGVEGCLLLEDVQDFNTDGYDDALMVNVQACGGNMIGNTFFFVFYDGVTFQRSQDFGYSWIGATVESWQGMLTVYTEGNNAGGNTHDEERIQQRHILRDGQAVKVWEYISQELPTLVELRSSAFDDETYQASDTIDFSYDLNQDGRQEIISCHLWMRWGALMCEVAFADGTTISLPSCKRIGVLESISNGMHELVCGDETLIVWRDNGYKVVE